MSIVNRRNAVMGWAAWSIGKRALKKKAKSALPSGRGNGIAAAVASGLAALGGLLFVWRRRRGGSDDQPT